MGNLSDKQQEVLNQVTELLDEHFEGSALVIRAEEVDDEEDVQLSYHGGRAQAIGLLLLGLEIAKHINEDVEDY